MPSYKCACKDMQKKAKQLMINSFFTKSPLLPSILHTMQFDNPEQLSVMNTVITPVNMNTNVVMCINHSCTYYCVFKCHWFTKLYFSHNMLKSMHQVFSLWIVTKP